MSQLHCECNSNSGVLYLSHTGFSGLIIVFCCSLVWSGRTLCGWRSGGYNSGCAEIGGLGCLQLFTAKVCLSLLSVKDRNRMETQVEVENTMWEPLVQGGWQMIKTWPWCLAKKSPPERGRRTHENPMVHLQLQLKRRETTFRAIWGLCCCQCSFAIIIGSKAVSTEQRPITTQPSIQLALGILMKYFPRLPNYAPSLITFKAIGPWLLL